LKGHNFFNDIPFLTIFSAPDTLIGRVEILVKQQKQWSLPLDLAWLEHLNVIVATQFATNE